MALNSSTLAALRYFVAAARASSFKLAAVELHVTQGAVSQRIKHLEDAIGVKLFYRRVRHIALTEEGERFATIVTRALADIERGAQSIALPRAPIDIRLRAGASFSLYWLIPRLGAFYAGHSGIRLFVNAVHGSFDPTCREFDLAIETTRGRIPGMQCETLMDDYLVPVCSPDYLKEHAFLRCAKDLSRCGLLHDAQPWIGASEDAEWRYWLDAVGAESVASRRGQFFSLSSMAIEAALQNQGIAIGRRSLASELLASGRLVAPLGQWVRSPTKYSLVFSRELATRPGPQAVIRWLHEQAKYDLPQVPASAAR